MRKFRKAIVLCLAAVLACTMFPACEDGVEDEEQSALPEIPADVETAPEFFLYTKTESKTEGEVIGITGYIGTEPKVVIPSVIDDCPVRILEPSSFAGNTVITSVKIPESVRFIGSDSFANCENLVSVNIPSLVPKIEGRAFYQCGALSEIIIPDATESIGFAAFFGCSSLASVTIGNSVQTIDEAVFSGCASLSLATINTEEPPSLTGSGDIFTGCDEDLEILVPVGCSAAYTADTSDWKIYESRIAEQS